MAQADSGIPRPRVPRPRPHPFRDLALDVLFGMALITAGLAGFAWLIVTIGRPL
jgi:hypothetical protein